jgi:hypothetical protein
MSNQRGGRAVLLYTAANNADLKTVLVANGETISGVRINAVWLGSNVAASATIARGANTVLVVPSGADIVDLAMAKFPMALDPAANVSVTFSAAGTHTLIVEFQKESNRVDAV